MPRLHLALIAALVATSTSTGQHWAFVAPKSPPVPTAANASNPIDAFIRAKLREKGVEPAPPPDKFTLIRRATFDLTGLPPTAAAVDAFLADTSPDSYANLVERLLASPAYGERQARLWLDVARFADTKGYVFFEEAEFPWAWTYRDYVARAFNENLPYDQFVREQIAADLIPEGDKRSLAGLGFLTIGGRFMNNTHDIIDDRIDTVTRGFMGLTVSCARCHDHKFDPIPTADYYSLYGVFASSVEAPVPPTFLPPPDTDEYRAFATELAKRESVLTQFVRAKHDELVRGAKERAADYLLAAHLSRDQPRTDEFMLIADGTDINPTMLKRWRAYLAKSLQSKSPVFAAWGRFAELPDAEFAAKADTVPLGGNPLIAAALKAKRPKSMAEVAKCYGEVLNAADQAASTDAATEELRRVFRGADAPPNVTVSAVGDLALLPDRPSQAELQKLRKAVEEWRAKGPGGVPRAHTLMDSPSPTEPFVFRRGNPYQRGDAVPRRFLAVVAGAERKPFANGSGRLELAEAIASPSNPLTARVFVNRVWAWHFGRGLVATPSDFGTRSDAPSHPELLDHLATEFVRDGWNVKNLHRRIVTSATYRQSNAGVGDPDNAMVGRMTRRRLDFESMRDAMLAASGRLDLTIGGPPARDILGGGANRRTLYGFLDRLNLPGLYRTFDFPHPDATSPRRDETTVPPQALFLMNHPFARDCAAAMLRRPDVIAAPSKVDALYRACFGRSATPAERSVGEAFVADGGTWEAFAHALMMTNEFVFVD